MKVIVWTLIALTTILLSSGCTNKEYVVKKEIVDKPSYKFEKIDITGAYIDMETKDVQKACTPKMIELDMLHKGIRDFYEWQIDEYEKVANDNRRKE